MKRGRFEYYPRILRAPGLGPDGESPKEGSCWRWTGWLGFERLMHKADRMSACRQGGKISLLLTRLASSLITKAFAHNVDELLLVSGY